MHFSSFSSIYLFIVAPPIRLLGISNAFLVVPSGFFFCGAFGTPVRSRLILARADIGLATLAIAPALVAPAEAVSLILWIIFAVT